MAPWTAWLTSVCSNWGSSGHFAPRGRYHQALRVSRPGWEAARQLLPAALEEEPRGATASAGAALGRGREAPALPAHGVRHCHSRTGRPGQAAAILDLPGDDEDAAARALTWRSPPPRRVPRPWPPRPGGQGRLLPAEAVGTAAGLRLVLTCVPGRLGRGSRRIRFPPALEPAHCEQAAQGIGDRRCGQGNRTGIWSTGAGGQQASSARTGVSVGAGCWGRIWPGFRTPSSAALRPASKRVLTPKDFRIAATCRR